MIISPADSSRLVVVTQTDHARLAAELLSLWRHGGLPDYPWRRELIFATREHDNGWAENDSAPSIGPDGRPYDFVTIPTEVRRRLWRRGARRHVAENPLAALWITRHALHIHRSHIGDADWLETFDAWRALERSLMDEGVWTAEEVDAGYRWLELADTISLAACSGLDEPSRAHGFKIRPIPGNAEDQVFSTVVVDPMPLAGSTTFETAARIIEDRDYGSDTDLALALAGARWQRLKIRVDSGSESGIR